MSWAEHLTSEKLFAFGAGVAGAAAMAFTDWRTPWRCAQHIFVGVVASIYATPIFAPIIMKALGWISVAPEASGNAAVFLTGAFAIYVLELARAIWRVRTRSTTEGKADG